MGQPGDRDGEVTEFGFGPLSMSPAPRLRGRSLSPAVRPQQPTVGLSEDVNAVDAEERGEEGHLAFGIGHSALVPTRMANGEWLGL